VSGGRRDLSQIKLDETLFGRKKGKKKNNNHSVKVEKANNNNNGLHILYIDVHEPEEIVEMFRLEKGIYVKVVPLEVGDYAFSNIGIERKTLKDFYSSIVHGDKHIWKQVFNLKRAFDRPFLIVERWDPTYITSERMERTIFGALARISLMGINVVVIPGRGKNFRDFVQFVSYLFFSSNKKTLSMKPIPEKRKFGSRQEYIEDLLCMIPLIGRKQAKQIASRVNSVKELCEMSETEIKKLCPGLGKKRIAFLKWVLKGEELPSDIAKNLLKKKEKKKK